MASSGKQGTTCSACRIRSGPSTVAFVSWNLSKLPADSVTLRLNKLFLKQKTVRKLNLKKYWSILILLDQLKSGPFKLAVNRRPSADLGTCRCTTG